MRVRSFRAPGQGWQRGTLEKRVVAMSNEHFGSSIEAALIFHEVVDESQAQAVKEVVAWKLAQTGMTEEKLIRLEDT
jgi:hypothetical protein